MRTILPALVLLLAVATARADRLPLATHDIRIRRSRQTSLWVA